MQSSSPIDTSLRPVAAGAGPERAVPVDAQPQLGRGLMARLKYLDVAVVLVGVIVALAAGGPSLGLIIGGAAWVLQRVVQVGDRRLTARIEVQTQRAGWRLFEAFGRIWLLAGAIVIAAVAGQRKDGLAATVVIFAGYSVAFLIRLFSGPPAGHESTVR